MKKKIKVLVLCALVIAVMGQLVGCGSKESKDFTTYQNEDMKDTRALFEKTTTEMEAVTSKESQYTEYEKVFPSCLTNYQTCLSNLNAYQPKNDNIKAINELFKTAIQARITYVEKTIAEVKEGKELDTEQLFNAANDAVNTYNKAATDYASKIGLKLEEKK